MSACLCTPRSKKPEALKANVGLWYKAGDIELHVGVEKRDGCNKNHLACEVENIEEVRRYWEENSVPTQDEKRILGAIRFLFCEQFGFLAKRKID